MSGSAQDAPRGLLARGIHSFEETAIALMLGLMVVITFVNVVLRYVFNSMVIWGMEVVLILFAWLVLFGIAYGFKITAHLGVDALTAMAPPRGRRAMGLISAAICLIYALLMMKGAWDYWAPFAGLDRTAGRWFPLGLDRGTPDMAYFETDQVPMPGALRWLEDSINFGERYSKMPRVVPYLALPVAAALMVLRVAQAGLRILRGEAESMIVSHEAEDALDEARAAQGGR